MPSPTMGYPSMLTKTKRGIQLKPDRAVTSATLWKNPGMGWPCQNLPFIGNR